MPRVLLGKGDVKHQKLGILINGTIAVKEKSMEDVAQIIGMSVVSAYKYAQNPERLPLDKLLKLGRGLNIPIDDLRDAIRY